jgi:Cd(II)/Pb(II)-responsive transcriptional regulator
MLFHLSFRRESRVKIGELASATDTRVETIRFYEREGLLPHTKRSTANYRVYTSAHVERLAFIRNCRNLDMALDEVRELLRFRDAPGKDCANVNTLLDEHIGHVSQRIRELRALERELRVLRARCEKPGQGKDCGILGGLGTTSSRTSKSPTQRHVRGTH